jgi:beta-lactamase class A
MRRIGPILVVALLAAACGDDNTTPGSTTTPPTTATSSADPTVATLIATTPVELPDTAAGNQLRWVLNEAIDASDADYAVHFAATFLAQISASEARAELKRTAIGAITEILSSSPTELVVAAKSADGDVIITLTTDATGAHQIIGLGARPAKLPDAPSTFEGVDTTLASASAGATTSYLAAEVNPDGSLRTIRTGGKPTAVPLGSSFKLYVLGALVRAVEDGRVRWTDMATINDELKSLPSGEFQDRPSGSTVTVQEAAEKMIQISDNTATDMLIDLLGRDAVEAILTEMGMGESSRQKTLPFLTTKELFILKLTSAADALARYSAGDTQLRRTIISQLGAKLPAVADIRVDRPTAVDTIEWFATPTEIAAAHLWLDRHRGTPGFEPLDTILGDNPGVPLDPATWSTAAFKGGSEPGVIFLGWLLHRADGRRFVVVVSAYDTAKAVDEDAAVTAARGIIGILGTQS